MALFRHLCSQALICITTWKSVPGAVPRPPAGRYLQSCTYQRLEVAQRLQLLPSSRVPPNTTPSILASAEGQVVFHGGTCSCLSPQVHLWHISLHLLRIDLNVNPRNTTAHHPPPQNCNFVKFCSVTTVVFFFFFSACGCPVNNRD